MASSSSFLTCKVLKLLKAWFCSSLKTDKTHHDYYITMSNFEFKLLLGNDKIRSQIENFLEGEKPHHSLVERTLRQMKLFVDFTHQSNHEVIAIFKESIEVLEGYIQLNTFPEVHEIQQ
jgi:hypothetical protein